MNCEFVAGTFSCDFWSQFAEMRVSTVQIGKEQGVASSLWLQSQPRYSSRLVIRPCYNTSQLNASTRELREIELYLTFAFDGDRKSCAGPVRLDPYYLTFAYDLNGASHRTSV